MASGPMRWLGQRSYSIYLWNVLARITILSALGHTLLGDIAWVAMFVVLAEASFRFVERPLRAKLCGEAWCVRPADPRSRWCDSAATVVTGCRMLGLRIVEDQDSGL